MLYRSLSYLMCANTRRDSLLMQFQDENVALKKIKIVLLLTPCTKQWGLRKTKHCLKESYLVSKKGALPPPSLAIIRFPCIPPKSPNSSSRSQVPRLPLWFEVDFDNLLTFPSRSTSEGALWTIQIGMQAPIAVLCNPSFKIPAKCLQTMLSVWLEYLACLLSSLTLNLALKLLWPLDINPSSTPQQLPSKGMPPMQHTS